VTAISVDPRLKARRVAVRRAEGRRRLRRLVVALTVLSLVVAGYGLSRSPLLDIESVTYRGLENTSLDLVAEVAAIEEGSSLVGFDAAERERRLEALPWVDTAKVTRSWSGDVSVILTERTAVAAVMREQDQWALVDSQGRVLTAVIPQVPDVPRLSGVAAAGIPGSNLGEDAIDLLRLAELLPDSLDTRIEGIYRDGSGEIWISMKTADRVLFGTEAQLPLKVVAMVTVLEELDARSQVGWELDVSVATLPVVRELRPEFRPQDDRESGRAET